MINFDADAISVWINGFFALAALSGLLAIAAPVALMLSSRSATAASGSRSATRLPVFDAAYPGSAATDRAA